MENKKARAMLETQLQKLLWESVGCLEQYCNILYKANLKQPSQMPLEQLDRFIIILQTLRQLLQTIDE